MPAKPYHAFGSSSYSLLEPDHTLIYPAHTYSTAEITEAELTEYVANLQDCVLQITATTDATICAEIRTKARTHLRTQAPLLGANNRILDVWVNHSRPSGEGDVWRDDGGFWIHPSTVLIVAGAVIPIAVAQHVAGTWVSASVVAYKT